MVELVDLLVQKSRGKAEDNAILSGVLVFQQGKNWARIDNQGQLWGPIVGDVQASHGDKILVAIDQLNQPYVVYPAGTSSGGGGGPGSGFGWYSQKIGNGVATAFNINHLLNTKDVIVGVYQSASPFKEVVADVEHTDPNYVTVRTNIAPASNAYTVVVASGFATGGAVGGDKNYVHTQGSPAATWVVDHSLGKYVSVEVVDTGDSVVIPSVHYNSTDQVTLTFGSPTSGKAFCN